MQARLIRRLCNPLPECRPSAAELLRSDALPPVCPPERQLIELGNLFRHAPQPPPCVGVLLDALVERKFRAQLSATAEADINATALASDAGAAAGMVEEHSGGSSSAPGTRLGRLLWDCADIAVAPSTTAPSPCGCGAPASMAEPSPAPSPVQTPTSVAPASANKEASPNARGHRRLGSGIVDSSGSLRGATRSPRTPPLTNACQQQQAATLAILQAHYARQFSIPEMLARSQVLELLRGALRHHGMLEVPTAPLQLPVLTALDPSLDWIVRRCAADEGSAVPPPPPLPPPPPQSLPLPAGLADGGGSCSSPIPPAPRPAAPAHNTPHSPASAAAAKHTDAPAGTNSAAAPVLALPRPPHAVAAALAYPHRAASTSAASAAVAATACGGGEQLPLRRVVSANVGTPPTRPQHPQVAQPGNLLDTPPHGAEWAETPADSPAATPTIPSGRRRPRSRERRGRGALSTSLGAAATRRYQLRAQSALFARHVPLISRCGQVGLPGLCPCVRARPAHICIQPVRNNTATQMHGHAHTFCIYTATCRVSTRSPEAAIPG